MQKATAAIFITQFIDEFGCIAPLGRTERVRVPLGLIAPLCRHKGWLAAHGQAHVTGLKLVVDRGTQRDDVGPLFVAIGFSHAGRLDNARNVHRMAEGHLRLIDAAFDWRCAGWFGCAGQGDMPFARQQT